MSTVSYAILTSLRKGERSLENVPRYVDCMAAIVPAEALLLQLVILAFSTERSPSGSTTLVDVRTLQCTFGALVAFSVGSYLLSRGLSNSPAPRWPPPSEWFRATMPGAAFVLWSMLQRPSMFDAMAGPLKDAPRNAVAVIGLAVLFVAAAASTPTTKHT